MFVITYRKVEQHIIQKLEVCPSNKLTPWIHERDVNDDKLRVSVVK